MNSVPFDQIIYINYSTFNKHSLLHCSLNDPPFSGPVLLMGKSSQYNRWQLELDEELTYLLVQKSPSLKLSRAWSMDWIPGILITQLYLICSHRTHQTPANVSPTSHLSRILHEIVHICSVIFVFVAFKPFHESLILELHLQQVATSTADEILHERINI